MGLRGRHHSVHLQGHSSEPARKEGSGCCVERAAVLEKMVAQVQVDVFHDRIPRALVLHGLAGLVVGKRLGAKVCTSELEIPFIHVEPRQVHGRDHRE